MDKEKFTALAEDVKVVMDLLVEVLKEHKVEDATIASIAVCTDGYQNFTLTDENYSAVKVGDGEFEIRDYGEKSNV